MQEKTFGEYIPHRVFHDVAMLLLPALARARALTLRMMRLVRCVIVKNDYNATGAGFFRACRVYYILRAKSIDNI